MDEVNYKRNGNRKYIDTCEILDQQSAKNGGIVWH
ncbi:MAG: hypothetical protein QG641_478 [Candidatus Poribacteria bacterium]|nr:hypothetical protein [Candidatus Poribacteria bacterium]